MEVVCVHCPDYRDELLRAGLERILSSPDFHRVLQGKKRVLLKVNCLNPHPPQRGVTTHPALVRVLCQLLQERGCTVWVGDSAGGVSGKAHTAQALEVSGLAEAARQAGARVVNFDAGQAVAVLNPRPGGPDPLYVAGALWDSDVIINMPKLKTHLFTGLSAAVKNCYGGLPGAYKHQLHRDYPGLNEFSHDLVDVCSVIAPHLHIMDAIWSMEGNGPAMGTLVHTGLILASTDPFVLDGAACRVAGWPMRSVSTLVAAEQRGLLDDAEVNVWGDSLRPAKKPFRRPLSMLASSWVPGWLLRSAFRWLEPTVVIDDRRCTGCSFCIDSCPAGAMQLEDGRARVLRHQCIACYCCVELCRHGAVDLKRRYRVRWDEWKRRSVWE